MKYERRSVLVDAIQVNSLADAEEILRACPHVSGIVGSRMHLGEDPSTWYVDIETSEAAYRLTFSDYFVWDDRGVQVMNMYIFETKYRLSAG